MSPVGGERQQSPSWRPLALRRADQQALSAAITTPFHNTKSPENYKAGHLGERQEVPWHDSIAKERCSLLHILHLLRVHITANNQPIEVDPAWQTGCIKESGVLSCRDSLIHKNLYFLPQYIVHAE